MMAQGVALRSPACTLSRRQTYVDVDGDDGSIQHHHLTSNNLRHGYATQTRTPGNSVERPSKSTHTHTSRHRKHGVSI